MAAKFDVGAVLKFKPYQYFAISKEQPFWDFFDCINGDLFFASRTVVLLDVISVIFVTGKPGVIVINGCIRLVTVLNIMSFWMWASV